MRPRDHPGGYRLGAVALVLSLALVGCASNDSPKSAQQERPEPIVLVVMDPLAKEWPALVSKASGSGITASSPDTSGRGWPETWSWSFPTTSPRRWRSSVKGGT